ncbi:MAG: D-alanyl-D-alanine carboxypeptidase [Ruminococcaceae bacterium]|nr:D-alanyl-D-alanine carboxypeptidase [Oscillospiraceae bacterium]
MKRKLAVLLSLLSLILIFSPLSVHAKDYENEETLTSENIVVYNMDMEFCVYRKNYNEKVSPGSSVKIMTALLALEYFENRLDTIITVPATALRGLEGSAVLSLKEDEEISVLDLIHATLIAGMNDAANTLAFAIGGNMKNFVDLMNAKAKELGAFDTLYLNATGLSSSAYTTAYDTARIAAYAYENKLFMEICSKRFYTVAETNLHPAVTIYTRNSFLTPKSEYYYSNAEGMTTGYSNEDGAQLVCAASHGNYAYMCVAFGSKKDGTGTIGGYSDVKNLLAWASGNYAERKVLDRSQIICELPVRAGKDVAHVLIVPYKSVYAFLDKDEDLSKITLSEQLYYEKLNAPVQKGDCVGFVTVILDGLPIGSTPLIAKTNIRQSFGGGLLLGVEKVVTHPVFIAFFLIALPFLCSFIYKVRKKKLQKNDFQKPDA